MLRDVLLATLAEEELSYESKDFGTHQLADPDIPIRAHREVVFVCAMTEKIS
jgi:hypothetical protein